MIPIIYTRTETGFNTNGLGRLTDAISVKVEEQRNGLYELTAEYPLTGKHFADLVIGNILLARHSDASDTQPFRIYNISKPISGIITVHARHISYDLLWITTMPFTAMSVTEALGRFAPHAVNNCPFDFWTDKTTTANFSVKVPMAIRNALGGVEGSILDVYGGEFEWNRFTVKLHNSRGINSGVSVRYGKNLMTLEQTIDGSDVFTAIAPYWQDEEGNTVVLPEGAIYAENTFREVYRDDINVPYVDGNGTEYEGVADDVKVVPVDFSEQFEDIPTVEELRQAAATWLAKHVKSVPDQNITVSFVHLWQTEEYKALAPLQAVNLCDTVTVIYDKLGVNATAKVIRVVYDCLLERYDEIELGAAKSTLSDTVARQAMTLAEIVKTYPSRTDMDEAVQHATKLITGGLGGHVVINNSSGKPNEILIMDSEDKNTARNVIRMNENGIGFSTTGYHGPFTTAWTIDGSFVADFITAGSLNASVIKSGLMQSTNGRAYFNLDAGYFAIQDSRGLSRIVLRGWSAALFLQRRANTSQDWDYSVEMGADTTDTYVVGELYISAGGNSNLALQNYFIGTYETRTAFAMKGQRYAKITGEELTVIDPSTQNAFKVYPTFTDAVAGDTRVQTTTVSGGGYAYRYTLGENDNWTLNSVIPWFNPNWSRLQTKRHYSIDAASYAFYASDFSDSSDDDSAVFLAAARSRSSSAQSVYLVSYVDGGAVMASRIATFGTNAPTMAGNNSLVEVYFPDASGGILQIFSDNTRDLFAGT